MGRKAEYHIAYRKRRRELPGSCPGRPGGREFIHGSTRVEVIERLNRKLKERRERPNQETRLTAEMPLARYVDRYLNTNRDGLEPKTLRSYEQLLKGHVLPFRVEGQSLGAIKLCQIRRRHLKALITAKRKAGYAKDTVRLMRAAISTVLTDAVDDELISANPALRLMAKSGGKEERKRKSEMDEKVRAMDGRRSIPFSRRHAHWRIKSPGWVTRGAAAPMLRSSAPCL